MNSRCQFCQCTEENPCRLSDGDECYWLSGRKDTCTNPSCIRALQTQKKASLRSMLRERRDEVRRVCSGWKKKRKKSAKKGKV